jgi:hypothetical protein
MNTLQITSIILFTAVLCLLIFLASGMFKKETCISKICDKDYEHERCYFIDGELGDCILVNNSNDN